jgi:hypothetical protein
MVDWFCTKERAIDHARERAIEIDASLIAVEGADWTVEDLIHVEPASGPYLVRERAPEGRMAFQSASILRVKTSGVST